MNDKAAGDGFPFMPAASRDEAYTARRYAYDGHGPLLMADFDRLSGLICHALMLFIRLSRRFDDGQA